MKSARVATVTAAAAVVLAVVGGAAAANSGTITDPTADVSAAPDIVSLAVSSTDAGTVTFKIAVANRPDSLKASDEVAVSVDTDQNPDTGTALYGADVVIAFEGTQLVFIRANAQGQITPTLAPASLKGSFASGVATFSISSSDLGLTTKGFNVVADGFDDNTGDVDAAPDLGTVNFELSPGTPAVVPTWPDTRAPVDVAIPSSGTHGKVAHLWYYARDGRGRTEDTINIYRGRRLLKRIAYAMADTNPLYPYYAKWKVPKKVRGKLRFCVTSRDVAGNLSAPSCAAFVVR